jgi:hypothetical protein
LQTCRWFQHPSFFVFWLLMRSSTICLANTGNAGLAFRSPTSPRDLPFDPDLFTGEAEFSMSTPLTR